jgi:erythromycin esterase
VARRASGGTGNAASPPGETHAERAASALRELAAPLRTSDDLTPLLGRIGDARVVLLGEATHGTLEFYGWRAQLSARLIGEKGFSFVAVEGDWPDCYEVKRYVRAYPGAAASDDDALRTFSRWPTWMWANWEVAEFVKWLRPGKV